MSDADIHAMIMATPLPPTIVRRIKGKSRIAVRTVSDLHLHIVVIQELFYRYSTYSGCKKAIADLLQVTPNRITEWLRIWSYAEKQRQYDPVVYRLMNNPETLLKDLSAALKHSTSLVVEGEKFDQSMLCE